MTEKAASPRVSMISVGPVVVEAVRLHFHSKESLNSGWVVEVPHAFFVREPPVAFAV